MIKSERINIVPFEMKYLNDYFSGFNAEITKFQCPVKRARKQNPKGI